MASFKSRPRLLAIEGSTTSDAFAVARFLTEPGVGYETSVEKYSPYTEVKKRVDEARTAAAKLLEASFVKKKLSYLYVNNRLEGCAPLTLAGMVG